MNQQNIRDAVTLHTETLSVDVIYDEVVPLYYVGGRVLQLKRNAAGWAGITPISAS